MPRTKNYLNNPDLLEELYISIEKDNLTPKAVDMLMKLAQRTQRKLYYSCEDDKQHSLSEAYFDLIKRWRGFSPYEVRSSGFEIVEIDEKFKFYKDAKDRSTITKCQCISEPEICVYKKGRITYLKLSEVNINLKETKEVFVKENPHLFSKPGYNGPKLPKIVDVLAKKFSNNNTGIFTPHKSRIRVSYKIDKDTSKECYAYKHNTIIKTPNPFAYFTSCCINGYAKGYKELHPKKDKGRYISLDAGFNNEDGTDIFNA